MYVMVPLDLSIFFSRLEMYASKTLLIQEDYTNLPDENKAMLDLEGG